MMRHLLSQMEKEQLSKSTPLVKEKGSEKSPVKKMTPVKKKTSEKKKTPVKRKTPMTRKTPVKKTSVNKKTPVKTTTDKSYRPPSTKKVHTTLESESDEEAPVSSKFRLDAAKAAGSAILTLRTSQQPAADQTGLRTSQQLAAEQTRRISQQLAAGQTLSTSQQPTAEQTSQQPECPPPISTAQSGYFMGLLHCDSSMDQPSDITYIENPITSACQSLLYQSCPSGPTFTNTSEVPASSYPTTQYSGFSSGVPVTQSSATQSCHHCCGFLRHEIVRLDKEIAKLQRRIKSKRTAEGEADDALDGQARIFPTGKSEEEVTAVIGRSGDLTEAVKTAMPMVFTIPELLTSSLMGMNTQKLNDPKPGLDNDRWSFLQDLLKNKYPSATTADIKAKLRSRLKRIREMFGGIEESGCKSTEKEERNG